MFLSSKSISWGLDKNLFILFVIFFSSEDAAAVMIEIETKQVNRFHSFWVDFFASASSRHNLIIANYYFEFLFKQTNAFI
jgi:hypothetical protein